MFLRVNDFDSMVHLPATNSALDAAAVAYSDDLLTVVDKFRDIPSRSISTNTCGQLLLLIVGDGRRMWLWIQRALQESSEDLKHFLTPGAAVVVWKPQDSLWSKM